MDCRKKWKEGDGLTSPSISSTKRQTKEKYVGVAEEVGVWRAPLFVVRNFHQTTATCRSRCSYVSKYIQMFFCLLASAKKSPPLLSSLSLCHYPRWVVVVNLCAARPWWWHHIMCVIWLMIWRIWSRSRFIRLASSNIRHALRPSGHGQHPFGPPLTFFPALRPSSTWRRWRDLDLAELSLVPILRPTTKWKPGSSFARERASQAATTKKGFPLQPLVFLPYCPQDSREATKVDVSLIPMYLIAQCSSWDLRQKVTFGR